MEFCGALLNISFETCCSKFVAFVVEMVRKHSWSLDACVGYAKLHNLFQDDEMVCTKTLYNELEAGNLPLTVFEVPDVLKRRVLNIPLEELAKYRYHK